MEFDHEDVQRQESKLKGIIIVNMMRMNMGELRLPLVEPDEKGKAQLEKSLKTAGLV